MFQEKRPTCVTVIGWAWVILGGLMFFSSIMALFSFQMMSQMSQSDKEFLQNMPTVFKYFPLIAISQIGIAVLGFISGLKFLKLVSWSRSVLEVLTWLLLLFIVGFGILMEFNWISVTSDHGPRGFDFMGAGMVFVIIGSYSVPLGIMIKYSRGEKVRNAIAMIAEPNA
jgi:hypothetical protein